MAADKTKKIVDQIAGECVAVRVRKLNRIVTNIYDDAFRSLGIKVSQLNILVVTGKLGTARPAEVCEILHLSVSTLSRNVERMKKSGWLQSVLDVDDGRAQLFELSDHGRKILADAAPAWRQAQKKTKALLGADVCELLVAAGKSI